MTTYFDPGAGSAGLALVADGQPVTVPEGTELFTARLHRDGPDLVIEGADGDVRIVGYFSGTPVDLLNEDGAVLRAHVVERLAGPEAPGQYAQAGGFQVPNPIGQVETLDGEASVQRADGTVEQLSIGTLVYENDVVETGAGGGLGITFVDGTIFTLAAGSRMLLDELIYDPEGSENSGVFNLIEGSFVFIAGQAARTGGMEVQTPTATMGIRGTTVKVDIQTVNGVTEVLVSLNRDPDGGVGAIELRDLDGNLIANITGTDTAWMVSPVDGETREIARSESDLANDQDLLSDALTAFQLATQRFSQSGTFVTLEGGVGSIAPPPVDDVNDPPPPPPPAPTDDTDDGDGDDQSDGGQGRDRIIDINDAPVGRDFTFDLAEDSTARGTLTAFDADGDPLTFALAEGAENGLVVLQANGQFTYTPNENFEGTDSFTYTVTDGELSDTRTVTFTVIGVNDAPVVQDVSLGGTDAIPNAGFDEGLEDWTPDTDLRVDFGSTVNLTGSVSHLAQADATSDDDTTAALLSIRGSVSGLATGSGPLLVSSAFSAVDGQNISVVYELNAEGTTGNRDDGRMRAYLRDADTDAFVAELFSDETDVGTTTGIQTFNGTIPSAGNYKLVFEVGSYDSTGGAVVGADLYVYSVEVDGPILEGQSGSYTAARLLASATDVENDALSLVSVSAFSANGARVSLVDGEVVFDTSTLSRDLAEGEVLTDTFTYTISDGTATTTGTASVNIVGSGDVTPAIFSSPSIGFGNFETPLVGSGLLDLTNEVPETVRLTASDVFNLSEETPTDPLFGVLDDGIRGLRILGDAEISSMERPGDQVLLEPYDNPAVSWVDNPDDPEGYDTWDLVQTSGGASDVIARVLIDTDVDVAVAQANASA